MSFSKGKLMYCKIFRKWLVGAFAFVGLGVSLGLFASDISQAQWRGVTQLSGIPSNSEMDAPSIYVFFDPNCPATAKLFRGNNGAKPFSDTPAVWIPVAPTKKDKALWSQNAKARLS